MLLMLVVLVMLLMLLMLLVLLLILLRSAHAVRPPSAAHVKKIMECSELGP